MSKVALSARRLRNTTLTGECTSARFEIRCVDFAGRRKFRKFAGKFGSISRYERNVSREKKKQFYKELGDLWIKNWIQRDSSSSLETLILVIAVKKKKKSPLSALFPPGTKRNFHFFIKMRFDRGQPTAGWIVISSSLCNSLGRYEWYLRYRPTGSVPITSIFRETRERPRNLINETTKLLDDNDLINYHALLRIVQFK